MKIKISKKIVIVLIISLFLIINTFWFVSTYLSYKGYKDEYKDNDGFSYAVKKPDYLSFVGNLSLVDKENKFILIIWPSVFSKKIKYGFMINTPNRSYQFYTNKNLEPINVEDKELLELINSNKIMLETLFDKANSVWILE